MTHRVKSCVSTCLAERVYQWLCLCVFPLYRRSASIVLSPRVLNNFHLLYGYPVGFDDSVRLCHSVVNLYGIHVLHVRQTHQFVDGDIITDITLLLRILFPPFPCRHSKHRYVEYISLVGILHDGLLTRDLRRDEIGLDGIRMNTIVYFGKFPFGRPLYLLLLSSFQALELSNKIQLEPYRNPTMRIQMQYPK